MSADNALSAAIAALRELADEWTNQGCGYRFADGETEDYCADQLRAVLAEYAPEVTK